jgi:hypothetical protein
MKLIVSDTPSDQIRVAALEAKFESTDEYAELSKALNLVHQLVANYAFDPAWVWGWLTRRPATEPPDTASRVRSARAERVTAIARDMHR